MNRKEVITSCPLDGQLKAIIKGAPKAELHCHLDGSLSLKTVRTLADMTGVELPGEDGKLLDQLQVEENCDSLVTYLKRFDLPLSLLQTEETLEYAACSLVKDAAAEHVIYLEVRFAPLLSMRQGLSCDQVVESVIRGLKRGQEETHTRAAALLCAMRHEAPEVNLAILDTAKKYLGKGVCGLDMAGDEFHYPPLLHREFFEQARTLGIPFTIHAGECGSAQNVKDCLLLGARRIGHGIALKHDPDILSMAAESGCGIEMCPTSNLQTKAVSAWEEYPFLTFLNADLRVTVNTDNRMVSNTTLTRELELLWELYDLKPEQIMAVTLNAVEVAFADEEQKEQMAAQVADYWKKMKPELKLK